MFALPISHTDALEIARNVVFERMIDVAFSEQYIGTDTQSDGRKLGCHRLTVRRFGCKYKFTVESPKWGILYRESGRMKVSTNRILILKQKNKEAFRKNPNVY